MVGALPGPPCGARSAGSEKQGRCRNAGRRDAAHRTDQSPVNSAPFNLGEAFNEAVALHRQGRLRDAEKIYTRVLKAAPDHFDALNLLGTVKWRLGRIGEAHRLFTAALKIRTDVPQVWSNLGQVLQILKRPKEALECHDRAYALAPDNVDILNSRANTLLSLGRPQEARASV